MNEFARLEQVNRIDIKCLGNVDKRGEPDVALMALDAVEDGPLYIRRDAKIDFCDVTVCTSSKNVVAKHLLNMCIHACDGEVRLRELCQANYTFCRQPKVDHQYK